MDIWHGRSSHIRTKTRTRRTNAKQSMYIYGKGCISVSHNVNKEQNGMYYFIPSPNNNKSYFSLACIRS